MAGRLGLMHGDPDAARRAVEAVPIEHHDNIASQTCRWFLKMSVRGDAHAAGALVDARRLADRFEQVWTEFARRLVDGDRVGAGEP
jgi:hypothetical protein